jgi:hypothetical protein
MAGQLDRPPARSRLVQEAFHHHAEIDAINRTVFMDVPATGPEMPGGNGIRRRDFFSPNIRPPQVSRRIDELRAHLRTELYAFAAQFDVVFRPSW